jgi:acyl carrier protein
MADGDNLDLEKKIIHFFSISFKKDESTLSRDTRIKEDLGGTSMLMVSLVSLVENEMDVLIPLPEASRFKTIGEMIDRLKTHTDQR